MQNYAKFDSRVSDGQPIQQQMNMPNEAFSNIGSISNSYDTSYKSYSANNVVLFDQILIFTIFFLGIITFLGLIYFIISLFVRGGEKTLIEIKRFLTNILNGIVYIFKKIYDYFKLMLNFLWQKKNITCILIILIIVGSFGYNFINNVINNNSKLLVLTKIKSGYLGIDLKNQRILQPGYHLISPIWTDIFLSSNSIFDFEIAEVTANTKEEMPVVLDYRVYFLLQENRLLDFYKQYSNKSIQQISSDVVMPKVLETVKAIIIKYSFKEISSQHNVIKEETITQANKVLDEIGIRLTDVNILDIRLPESYVQSIEDTEKATNDIKLAEALLEKQKKENEAAIEKAENEKKIKIIEAESIARYNQIINNSGTQINDVNITDKMLELKRLEIEKLRIQKWDGKLPSTIYGNSEIFKLK